jgi:hypothetical protein
MLFSGEDSITRAGWLPPAAAEEEEEPDPDGVALVLDVLDEHAARPAAASAAAVTASARLLDSGHFVNIDFPLGVFHFLRCYRGWCKLLG